MLDGILERLVEREEPIAEIVADGFDRETVMKVERMLDLAEYKRRQAAPGVKVTLKNFGRDRRYPIVNRFRDSGAPLPEPDRSLLKDARGAGAKRSISERGRYRSSDSTGEETMYKASAGVTLPTSIIGSLPRPAWYTAVLGSKSFLEAMVNSRYREQYEDAVSCFLRAQEIAGLDICTDGDAHYDEEVGGMSWQGYPLTHMDGFADQSEPMVYKIGAVAYPRGHILHDFLEARVFPRIVGPVGRGRLQYTAMWKTAQRMTKKPVKFGTILPELIAASVEDDHYKDPVERTWAISDALNEELNELADAGCPVLQMEEPQIHMVPARGKTFGKLDVDDLVKIFNNTVEGPARQDRGLVPYLLGQPVAAAHLPRCAELSAHARGARPASTPTR